MFWDQGRGKLGDFETSRYLISPLGISFGTMVLILFGVLVIFRCAVMAILLVGGAGISRVTWPTYRGRLRPRPNTIE